MKLIFKGPSFCRETECQVARPVRPVNDELTQDRGHAPHGLSPMGLSLLTTLIVTLLALVPTALTKQEIDKQLRTGEGGLGTSSGAPAVGEERLDTGPASSVTAPRGRAPACRRARSPAPGRAKPPAAYPGWTLTNQYRVPMRTGKVV